jgi:flagellar protein FliL
MAKEAPAPEKPAAEGEAAPPKAPNPLIPVIAVVVLMPAITFAMINFLLLPKIKGIVLEQKATEHAEGGAKADGGHGAKPAAAHGAKEEKGGHGAKKEAKGGHGKEEKGGSSGTGGAFSYDFENVVVNLAGTMGTRYLKTSFTALSENPDVKTIIEENKKQLLDVTLNVLSTRTLADLEQPGAKNVVRNDLMANLNQALKSDLITQIYFSDFVIQ